ncbi:MAG: helix-turn-helix domain-containing protein, partial [Nitrospirota bacterium]|nr:helix-turn-helix domain-containing protein [Nitrospirota bacterium]
MKQQKRRHYTEAERAFMWDRWQKGDSMRDIGKLFGKNHTSANKILRTEGGIRPYFRTRKAGSLSLAEREAISRGLARQLSMRSIAAELG